MNNYQLSTIFTKVVRSPYFVLSPQSTFYTESVFYTQSAIRSPDSAVHSPQPSLIILFLTLIVGLHEVVTYLGDESVAYITS